MSITHIPFYPSDWLGGTRNLSDAETGVYITLICHMYEMAGPIKRNDERLSRFCGCKSKAGFVKILKYLVSEGKITEQKEGLFNDKAQEVIQKVIEKSLTARQAAQRRWDKKPNENNVEVNAYASQTHMHQPCYPKPKPDSTNITTLVSSNDVPASPNGEGKNQFTKEFETIWPHYPRKVSKKQSLINYIKARKKFSYADIAKPLREFIDATMKFGDPENMIHFSTWLHQERFSDEDQQAAVTGRTSKGYTNGRQEQITGLDDWADKAASVNLTPPPDGT